MNDLRRFRDASRRTFGLNSPFCHLLLALLGAVCLAGCSSQQSGGCAVSGRVTLNGAPLPDGLVAFHPQTPAPGLRSVSATVTNGEFSVPPAHLLMPGTYRVWVTAEKETGEKMPAGEGRTGFVAIKEQYIPPKYNAQTTLSAEITGDTDNLEFPLRIP